MATATADQPMTDASAVVSASSSSSSSAAQNMDIDPSESKQGSAPVHVGGGARKGAKQYQEDSHMWWRSANEVVVVAAVFDGHGGFNGAISSNTAQLVTETFLNNVREECESWSVETWSARLDALFETIHTTIREKFLSEKSPDDKGGGARVVDAKGIVRVSNGDPVHGGTTGSVVVLIRPADGSQHVIVSANVGDSTCLLLPERGNVEFLTVDHGPENSDEYRRVQQLPRDQHPEKLLYVYDKANVFRKYECPRVFLESGVKDPIFVENPWGNGLHPTNVRYEPAVYAVTARTISKDTTCIAMTRALGDFYAHQFGLTFRPSVTVVYPPMDTRYCIAVASDGIWDCWKYEDFLAYVNIRLNTDANAQAAADTILNESINRAIANFGAKHYDDASLILVVTKPGK